VFPVTGWRHRPNQTSQSCSWATRDLLHGCCLPDCFLASGSEFTQVEAPVQYGGGGPRATLPATLPPWLVEAPNWWRPLCSGTPWPCLNAGLLASCCLDKTHFDTVCVVIRWNFADVWKQPFQRERTITSYISSLGSTSGRPTTHKSVMLEKPSKSTSLCQTASIAVYNVSGLSACCGLCVRL
jgi:hypothetical protein